MHRHRGFRHGPRQFHPWGPFRGAFWLIGLAILFSSGHWWPGILILVGLSMLFGSFFHEEGRWEREDTPERYDTPMPPPPAPRAEPVSFQQNHRVDLLPVTCPQCGGPIRSHEVQWTGAQSAMCPFCGSNLPMKKS